MWHYIDWSLHLLLLTLFVLYVIMKDVNKTLKKDQMLRKTTVYTPPHQKNILL